MWLSPWPQGHHSNSVSSCDTYTWLHLSFDFGHWMIFLSSPTRLFPNFPWFFHSSFFICCIIVASTTVSWWNMNVGSQFEVALVITIFRKSHWMSCLWVHHYQAAPCQQSKCLLPGKAKTAHRAVSRTTCRHTRLHTDKIHTYSPKLIWTALSPSHNAVVSVSNKRWTGLDLWYMLLLFFEEHLTVTNLHLSFRPFCSYLVA